MVILARQDGILRLAEPSEIKSDWQYRLVDKTEGYCLIDYDAEKAQPIVKSILSDLDLFPEMRILKNIRIIIILVSTVSIFLSIWIIIAKPSKAYIKENIEKIQIEKTTKDQLQKPVEIKSIMEEIGKIK